MNALQRGPWMSVQLYKECGAEAWVTTFSEKNGTKAVTGMVPCVCTV